MIYTFHAYSFPCTVIDPKPRRDGWLYIRNDQTGRHSWANPQYLTAA